MEVNINVSGLDAVKAKFEDFENHSRQMMAEVGYELQEKTADHIYLASLTRHKTAWRLGASPTRFLEFSPGRTKSTTSYRSPEGESGTIESVDVSSNSVTVAIENTPGISRAFKPLEIKPVKAKHLTIPIAAPAYGRRVADLRMAGWKIFRPKNTSVLLGKKNRGAATPLYALRKKVVVPQDSGLLPSSDSYEKWAADTAENFMQFLLGGGFD